MFGLILPGARPTRVVERAVVLEVTAAAWPILPEEMPLVLGASLEGSKLSA